jgi:DnaJ-class molecular chaperone
LKPLTDQTLYELLEVPFDAPVSQIMEAWERIHSLYGPGSLATYTLMAPDEAELLGARLEQARTILLDPEARRSYDATLSGTPVPRAGRAEDVSGRPLPPIIPPLAVVPALPDLDRAEPEEAAG